LKALGRHILAEFFDCDGELLKDTSFIENEMGAAAEACGATIVESCFHTFNPFGVSGAVVISESHLTIHTWPEYNYAAVDIFTCGDTVDPWLACEHLKTSLKSQEVDVVELNRGELSKDKVLRHRAMMIAEDKI
jgi:S-adenosylmethionine decarboxylase